MSVLAQPIVDRAPIAIDAFRLFALRRPDEETWELVDGVPIMMTPTHLGHARIASNMERLLSGALEGYSPSRIALQNIGVDLGLGAERLAGLGRSDRYAPQPDIGVIDAVFGSDQRFATHLYVAVEIVSSTDDAWMSSRRMRWIEAKTRLYQAHRNCEAVIVVEQHRIEVRLSIRTGETWRTNVFADPNDNLGVPTCGLACKVGDLYRGIPLAPSRQSG